MDDAGAVVTGALVGAGVPIGALPYSFAPLYLLGRCKGVEVATRSASVRQGTLHLCPGNLDKTEAGMYARLARLVCCVLPQPVILMIAA